MSQDYNVFISWSGERSFTVAKVLRDWLPMVIQAAKPWMSDTDIEKGSQGINEIAIALQGIRVGIVCLTPENQTEPWLLFEAGALSKTITADKTHLCTYLLGGLGPSDVKQPLGMFQHTVAEKEETRKLMHTINTAVSDSPVPQPSLNTIFDALWPQMEKTIATLPQTAPGATPKRDLVDMVGEILELVRAGANIRTNFVMAEGPIYGSPPTMVWANKESAKSGTILTQRFEPPSTYFVSQSGAGTEDGADIATSKEPLKK